MEIPIVIRYPYFDSFQLRCSTFHLTATCRITPVLSVTELFQLGQGPRTTLASTRPSTARPSSWLASASLYQASPRPPTLPPRSKGPPSPRFPRPASSSITNVFRTVRQRRNRVGPIRLLRSALFGVKSLHWWFKVKGSNIKSFPSPTTHSSFPKTVTLATFSLFSHLAQPSSHLSFHPLSNSLVVLSSFMNLHLERISTLPCDNFLPSHLIESTLSSFLFTPWP
jgi:hypothetical protein